MFTNKIVSPFARVIPLVRSWWMWLCLIVIMGGVLRFTGYNFGLPYIDTPDEPTFLTATLYYDGLYAQAPQKAFANYPPAILTVYHITRVALLTITHQEPTPAEIVQGVRIAAILTSLIGIIFMGLLARRLGGYLAGLLAALIWAVVPTVVANTSIGMTEAWLTLFCAMTLYFCVLQLETRQAKWAILSIFTALMGVIFKYSVYPLLGVVIGATLWQIISVPRDQRRRWLSVLVAQIGATGLCALWLIFAFNPAQLILFYSHLPGGLPTESGNPITVFFSNALNIAKGVEVLNQGITQLGIALWLGLLILVMGTLLYWHQKKGPKRVAWLLILVYSLSVGWLVNVFLHTPVVYVGYYLLPADVGFIALFAVAIVSGAQWLQKRTKFTYVLTAAALLVWVVPLIGSTWSDAIAKTHPDTHGAAQLWVAHSLRDGSILVDRYNSKTFNREWGGYTGPYHVWLDNNLTEHSLAFWRAEYVNYAELPPSDVDQLKATPQGQLYLDNMLLLKEFPPVGQRDEWRGPSMMIFRLWPPQTSLDAAFNDSIHLIGYDLNAHQVLPGDMLNLTLYWRADAVPHDNYNVYIHLTAIDNPTPLAQIDGSPADRSSLTWNDPTETLISAPFTVSIPATLPPGTYLLRIGLYNYQTGQRLSVKGNDFVPVTIHVLSSDF